MNTRPYSLQTHASDPWNVSVCGSFQPTKRPRAGAGSRPTPVSCPPAPPRDRPWRRTQRDVGASWRGRGELMTGWESCRSHRMCVTHTDRQAAGQSRADETRGDAGRRKRLPSPPRNARASPRLRQNNQREARWERGGRVAAPDSATAPSPEDARAPGTETRVRTTMRHRLPPVSVVGRVPS